jgi:sodium transport system ATP-binding protein
MIHEGKIIANGTSQKLKEDTQTTNLRDAFISLASKGGELYEK